MKKTGNYLLIFLLVIFLPGCEKDTPLPYFGETGITFQPVNVNTDILPSTPNYPGSGNSIFKREFFFTYDGPGEGTRVLRIPVAVMGYTTEFSRPVNIEIDSATSTLDKSHYEIDPVYTIVPGGRDQAHIIVKLIRPDLNRKADTLSFRLLPNTYFGYVHGDGEYFDCILSNENRKPLYWDQVRSNIVNYTDYFGVYSNNKFDFIHEILYQEKEIIGYDPDNNEYIYGYPYRDYATLEGFAKLPGGMHMDVRDMLRVAYSEYKLTHPEGIMDENTGREIMFGN